MKAYFDMLDTRIDDLKQSNMRHPKRRANMLYKLRRIGIHCNTKERCIYLPYNEDPKHYPQIPRLCREFHFYVQFIIT